MTGLASVNVYFSWALILTLWFCHVKSWSCNCRNSWKKEFWLLISADCRLQTKLTFQLTWLDLISPALPSCLTFVFWAADLSGVATPLVAAQSNGSALQSLNHSSYCVTPGNSLDLLCSSAIEQGTDVDISWTKYQVRAHLSLILSVSFYSSFRA